MRGDFMSLRISFVLVLLAVLVAPFLEAARGQPEAPPFDQWLQALLAEARERGYSAKMLEEALGDVEPLPRVIRSDQTQEELIVTFKRYVSSRVTPAVVRRGRQLARQHRSLLTRIERTYQV